MSAQLPALLALRERLALLALLLWLALRERPALLAWLQLQHLSHE
jgi:hypothetical protein